MDRRMWREPCDELSVAEGIVLERGSALRITRGRQLLVYVQAGTVWLTQERDSRDIVADAGRWYRIDRDGLVVVSALDRAVVTLSAPLNAAPRWRIEGTRRDGRPMALRPGERRRSPRLVRALWAFWLRLHRAGARALAHRLGNGRAARAFPRLDPRTLRDIGLEGVHGADFAERADQYRWSHDLHFGTRGGSLFL
jgi:hypothetical protein